MLDTGLTSRGLGVIIAAALVAALAVLTAILYVLYRYVHDDDEEQSSTSIHGISV